MNHLEEPDEEAGLKLQLEDEVTQLAVALAKKPKPDLRAADFSIEFIKPNFLDLQKLVYARILRCTGPTGKQDRITVKQAWVDWKIQHQELFHAELDKYDSIKQNAASGSGGGASHVTKQKEALQARIDGHLVTIGDRITTLTTEITSNQDKQGLPRSLFSQLQSMETHV